MPIPDFQTLMLPVLRLLAANGRMHVREIRYAMADQFNLTADEREELLPSGRQRRISNRVGWAITDLVQAGVLVRPIRGEVEITDKGREVLASNPDGLTRQYLLRFPEFAEYQQRSRAASDHEGERSQQSEESRSPAEQIDDAYSEIRRSLAAELIATLREKSPAFFERIVIDLLLAMGYGGSRPEAAESLGRSGDGGVDGVISEDRLGLDNIYVQAKRYAGSVGSAEVREFAGSLMGQRSKKGVFLTTGTFSAEARNYVKTIDTRIVLIDGEALANHMIDYGIGVAESSRYVIHRIDNDYFDEE